MILACVQGYAARGDLWTEIERYKAMGMPNHMVLGYAAEIVRFLVDFMGQHADGRGA